MALRLFAAAALAAVSLAAYADPVTYTVTVQATGADANAPNGVQVVNLAYQLTFDATQNTLTPTMAGVTVLQASTNDPAFADSFAFPSNLVTGTAWQYFYVPNASLEVAGLITPGSLGVFPGIPDYLLNIAFSDGQPTLVGLTEATTGTDLTTLTDGTVTVTPPVPDLAAVTPEPSSVVLLGTGLLGVAGVLRRRVA